MSPEPKPGVIGSLPRTRPHRRSAKRAAPAGAPHLDTQSAAEPAVAKAAPPKRAPVAKAAAPVAKAAATPKRAPAAKTAKPKTPRPAAAATAAKPKSPPARKAAAPKRAPAAVKPLAPKPTAPSEPVAADASPGSHGVVETAVQAAAELAEIGLHASARALRRAVSRLPRP